MHNNLPAKPDEDQPDHPSSANHNDSHDEEHSATSQHPHNINYQAQQFHIPPHDNSAEQQQPTPLSEFQNLPHSEEPNNQFTEEPHKQTAIFLASNNHSNHQPVMSIPSPTKQQQKQEKLSVSQQQEQEENYEEGQQIQGELSQNYQPEDVVFHRNPTLVQCPFCKEIGLTQISPSIGKSTWCCSLLVGFATCCMCCCIPFFTSKCKNIKHNCQYCKKTIGTSKYTIC